MQQRTSNKYFMKKWVLEYKYENIIVTLIDI